MLSAHGANPLLERSDQLRILHTALDNARRSMGTTVVISGEPGIGKTALVTHFLDSHRTADAQTLVGVCDNLVTKRPLGAFRDIAQQLPPTGYKTHHFDELANRLMEFLRTTTQPTVLVVEDIHWADEATVDVLTLLTRRIGEQPVVVITTMRPGEIGPQHPLNTAFDSMHRHRVVHLQLQPLSRGAVGQLAGPRADRIFHLSGGNPLFVTELVAYGTDPTPPSLSAVILSRVARLPPASQTVLELLAVVPGRVPIHLLDVVHPTWSDTVDGPQLVQLLASDATHLWFRHELTRTAIENNLSSGQSRRLHQRWLDALLTTDADPADIVQHAEAALAVDVLADYAPIAARQAAAVSSHRAALEHYRRAARTAAGRLSLRDQADLAEDHAHTALLTGELDVAIEQATQAIHLADQLADTAQLGRCEVLRARLHWFHGDGPAAWQDSEAGMIRLQAVDEPEQLAAAFAQAAELSMLASNTNQTFSYGRRALALDGTDAHRIQALAAMGLMRLQLDVNDVSGVRQAIYEATQAGQHQQAVTAVMLKSYLRLLWSHPEGATELIDFSLPVSREHQYDAVTALFERLRAWLAARRGDFVTAMHLARIPAGPRSVITGRIMAHTVLAEVALRRGDAHVAARLHNLVHEVDRTAELCRILPVLELQIEQAMLSDVPLPTERVQQVSELVGHHSLEQGCAAGRFAAWARLCGVATPFRGKAPAPHGAMLSDDWYGAADEFGAIGWDYDRALMLSLTNDPHALKEALLLVRRLGTRPLEQRVIRQLRNLGVTIPRGPLRTTQTNPHGLTNRQLEVLGHLRQGLDNTQIAQLLVLSVRTVEHHVAAIFTKLQVSSRAEAIARTNTSDVA